MKTQRYSSRIGLVGIVVSILARFKMAGRAHVDVNERRLKPIYDYIDNRNYKKAVQEADKVLKKQRDLHCAKALKALALLRQGKHDAGSDILHEVHADHPTDDATLQAMTICYSEMHELESIADMYEHANRLKPDNEDLLSALFMAYVRVGHYQKQQRTAMALHKLKPDKNPYYFWALMSIVMQAHAADDTVKKMTFLKLAEKMAEKFITQKKVEVEAEVKMYLIILELESKFQEALDLVNGPLGEKLHCELNFGPVKTAELYAKMEQWSNMNAAYRQLLIEEPDQWCYYQEYIRSLIKLIQQGYEQVSPGDESKVDATIASADCFFKARQSCCAERNKACRGPYLAQLELIKQCQEARLEHPGLDSAYDLIYDYCRRFSHKPCCFSDVKHYHHLMRTDEQEKLLSQLEADVNLGTLDNLVYPDDEQTMSRHLTHAYLRHYLGATSRLATDQLIRLAQQYCLRHRHGLKFGQDRLSTDYQPSDNYLLLSAIIYYNLYKQTENEDNLWSVICILEKGLVSSPSNFKFKMILIQLYCLLGAFGPAADHYDELDTKHIQHDALGYIIINHAVRFGHYQRFGDIMSSMLKFFTVHHKETTDYLISSYKYGSFSKIHEFVRFRERLQNSFQFAAVTAEKLHLDLLAETCINSNDSNVSVCTEIDPENDKSVFSDLADNRDLGVLCLPDIPEHLITDEIKHSSFEEEKAWLKIRNLSVRMLAAAAQFDTDGGVTIHVNSVKNGTGEIRCMQEVLSELMVQLQEHITSLDARYRSPIQYPLSGVYRTRISQYLVESHSSILIECFKCLLHLYKFSIKTDDDPDKSIKFHCCDKLTDLMAGEGLTPVCAMNCEAIRFDAGQLERLVMITELLSQVTLILGVASKLLKPLKNVGARRNKRRNKEQQQPNQPSAGVADVIMNYNTLVEKVKKCYVVLEDVVAKSEETLLNLTVAGLAKIDLADDDVRKEIEVSREDIMKKVAASYTHSLMGVALLLHKKKLFVESLFV